MKLYVNYNNNKIFVWFINIYKKDYIINYVLIKWNIKIFKNM